RRASLVLRSFPTRRSSDLLHVGYEVFGLTDQRASRLKVSIRDVHALDVSGDMQTRHVILEPFEILLGEDQVFLRCVRHRLGPLRSEEHTSELQSRENLVCR